VTADADRLVLASRSPQRLAILEQAGIDVEVVHVDVEELRAGPAVEVARSNALRKARAGAALLPRRTVLGVDTLVALDGRIFGKPACEREAADTLKRLSGRTHAVVSGVAVLESGNPQVVHEVTKVAFRSLDDDTISSYVATREWCGRAGGYAIQGGGCALVAQITGDYLNVVGLPLHRLLDLDLRIRLRRE
jgi:septum formation protein